LRFPPFGAASLKHGSKQRLRCRKAVRHTALCLAQASFAFRDYSAYRCERPNEAQRNGAERYDLAEQGKSHARLHPLKTARTVGAGREVRMKFV